MYASLFTYLDSLQDVALNFLAHQIYLAPIVLLMLEEIGLPLPVSDLVIAYTGYQVTVGHIPYVVAYLLLLFSDILGATILYLLVKKYGKQVVTKFGKFIDLDMNKLDSVENLFRKYGPLFIIIGRHIIGFKIPITIFSGLSKMKYSTFVLSLAISDCLWIPFYLAVGEKLGPRTVHLFHVHHNYYLFAFIPLLIALLPFFLMRKRK